MGAGYGVRWIDNYYLSDVPRESRLCGNMRVA